ncbi:hypothetical protein [Aquimarina sp. 2201CG14-23]|uniref:hypothetical protein n=1 Tax=Aquimarina mycalae TaxID=3040073 RepID=UPI002477FA63|nr:hypothetical protein [Aquimarina sp. 2201CG14-23]MDH7448402.1 hypothetical protein [Aquimarina sp. 2201CG14-23]
MTTDTVSDLDTRKTRELINFLLKQEGTQYRPWRFLPEGCITEEFIYYDENAPALDFNQGFIARLLEIKDSIHFNSQKKLYLNFKMTKDIVPNKKIIPEKKIKELEREYFLSLPKDSPLDNFLKINCENTIASISKPIFNKTFDLAFVEFRINYGASSGFSAKKVYAFKDGIWVDWNTIGSVNW